MRLVFLLGLFLAATALSFGQTEKEKTTEKKEQKKEQHVKVVVNQNGKQIKIDTTFHFADDKLIKLKVDSLLKKLDVVDGKDGNANIFIMRSNGKTSMGSHAGGNMPGEQQIQVFYENGDSGKVKGMHKVIRIRDGASVVVEGMDDNMMPPPPPPPPPMPGMQIRSFSMAGGDPFAMDPNDADIVTYDKKDIGKGLEKITIVRKKHTPSPDEKNIELKVDVSDDKKK